MFNKKFVLVNLLLLFVGILFVVLIPPFQKPDEGNHFLFSMTVVGKVRSVFSNNKNCNLVYKDEINLPDYFRSGSIMGNYDSKFPISLYKNGFTQKSNESICFSEPRYKSYLNYLPTVFSFLIFSGYPILGYYFARFFGFILFLIMINWAFNIIKKEYRGFLIIYLLIPLVWQQVTAIGYDVILFSTIPVIFSYIVNFSTEKTKILFNDFLKFLLVLIFAVFSKQGSEIFLLTLLFIPYKKIDFKRIFKKEIFYFFLLLIFTIFSFFKIYDGDNSKINMETNVSLQKQIILNNPIFFIKTLFSTIEKDKDFYISSFLTDFGWLDYSMMWFFNLIIIAVSFYFLFISFSKIKKSVFSINKLLILGLFICLYLFIPFLAMYLFWSYPGSSYIAGVQGRYFIPILPFFLFFLIELKLKIGSIKFRNFSLVFCLIIFLCGFVNATYKRYYDYSKLYQNPVELKDNYNSLNKTPKKIEEVLLNKEIDVEINLKSEKFSGFQIVTKLPKEKVVIPYAYSIVDGNNKIIQKGYIPVKNMVDGGIYQEEFKIKEVNTKKVTIKIWPLIIDNKENYISLLKDKENNFFLINLLYIRK